VTLRLPPYQPLPPPDPSQALIEVRVADLQPTQMCVGLAEVRSRQQDFLSESAQERRSYLGTKPVPLVMGAEGQIWMVDRHHRLRGLVELDPGATAFGYVVLQMAEAFTSTTEGGWVPVPAGPCPNGCSTCRMIPTAVWCGN
jgi:hypothetical protein